MKPKTSLYISLGIGAILLLLVVIAIGKHPPTTQWQPSVLKAMIYVNKKTVAPMRAPVWLPSVGNSTNLIQNALATVDASGYEVSLWGTQRVLPINSHAIPLSMSNLIGGFGVQTYASSAQAKQAALSLDQTYVTHRFTMSSQLFKPLGVLTHNVTLSNQVTGQENATHLLFQLQGWRMILCEPTGNKQALVSLANTIITDIKSKGLPKGTGQLIVNMGADGNHSYASFAIGTICNQVWSWLDPSACLKMANSMQAFPGTVPS